MVPKLKVSAFYPVSAIVHTQLDALFKIFFTSEKGFGFAPNPTDFFGFFSLEVVLDEN